MTESPFGSTNTAGHEGQLLTEAVYLLLLLGLAVDGGAAARRSCSPEIPAVLRAGLTISSFPGRHRVRAPRAFLTGLFQPAHLLLHGS